MTRVGLLSDTHGYLEDSVFRYFNDCDEIWHAGDIGSLAVTDTLEAFKPLRAVYGNIDGGKLRQRFPLDQRFECEGVDVWMTHIGGYPGRYAARVKALMSQNPPALFISGHSHILKVVRDHQFGLLHINPGACGIYGFHKVKTIVRFGLEAGKVQDLEVIELGKRGALK